MDVWKIDFTLRLRVSCLFFLEVLAMSLWIQELCYLLFRSLFWTQYNDLTPFFACKWWLILENPTPFILRISLVLPPIPWSVVRANHLLSRPQQGLQATDGVGDFCAVVAWHCQQTYGNRAESCWILTFYSGSGWEFLSKVCSFCFFAKL